MSDTVNDEVDPLRRVSSKCKGGVLFAERWPLALALPLRPSACFWPFNVVADGGDEVEEPPWGGDDVLAVLCPPTVVLLPEACIVGRVICARCAADAAWGGFNSVEALLFIRWGSDVSSTCMLFSTEEEDDDADECSCSCFFTGDAVLPLPTQLPPTPEVEA